MKHVRGDSMYRMTMVNCDKCGGTHHRDYDCQNAPAYVDPLGTIPMTFDETPVEETKEMDPADLAAAEEAKEAENEALLAKACADAEASMAAEIAEAKAKVAQAAMIAEAEADVEADAKKDAETEPAAPVKHHKSSAKK